MVAPPASNKYSANHINDPYKQRHETTSFFPDGKKYGFDVKFEENPGNVLFIDTVRLRRNSVLVREDRRGSRRAWIRGSGIYCWDDGAVVLKLEEIFRGGCVCFVQWVENGRIQGPKGEFVDCVGKVESYCQSTVSALPSIWETENLESSE